MSGVFPENCFKSPRCSYEGCLQCNGGVGCSLYVWQISGEDQLLDVRVSNDGMSHKCGHTSHFGVGVAIKLNSGLVTDSSPQSNYYQLCTSGPKPGFNQGFQAIKNGRKAIVPSVITTFLGLLMPWK